MKQDVLEYKKAVNDYATIFIIQLIFKIKLSKSLLYANIFFLTLTHLNFKKKISSFTFCLKIE